MKHTHTLAALLTAFALPICAQEKDETKTEKNTSSNSVTIANGKATVTVEINGKKETKTFDIGDADDISINADGKTTKLNTPGKPTKPKETVTWLGIATHPTDPGVIAQLPIENGTGLSIRAVAPESPAAKAGLQENDVLARLGDQLLVNHEQLETLIHAKAPGDTVELTYFRKGKETKATITLTSHAPDKTFPGFGDGKRLRDTFKKPDLFHNLKGLDFEPLKKLMEKLKAEAKEHEATTPESIKELLKQLDKKSEKTPQADPAK